LTTRAQTKAAQQATAEPETPQSDQDATDSATVDAGYAVEPETVSVDPGDAEPVDLGGWTLADAVDVPPSINVGEIVDAEIVGEPDERLSRDDEKPTKDTPKSGPPTLDEWMDFFSRVVFRTLCDFYVDFVFRGVDEDDIAPKDLEKLKMTKAERREISVPLASFANKSKLARKHGRSVIAFADSLDALVMLGMWVARVNKVAARYQPLRQVRPKKGRNSERQSPPTANGGINGDGAIQPEGLRIFNPGHGG
jgi:hypothetical protein